MKLAILTQYYPPETGAPQNRLSDLAARLVGWGHSVEVLTALPNYPGDHILPEYVDRANSVEDIDGVRVARVNLYVPKRRTFTRRLAGYLSFAANALRNGTRLLTRPDVVMMESPPLFLALAGVPLTWRLGAPLVANISDLWPASAVELGMIGPGPALWASEQLEAWMYRSATTITGQSEGTVHSIRTRFPDKRVELFPNGVDVSAYTDDLDRAGPRAQFGWNDEQFVIGYAGVLGHAQALGQVLDAAVLLRDLPWVHLALFGDGPCRGELEARIEREGISNLRLYGRVPRETMPSLQASFDAGLVPLAKGHTFENVVPSKMFEVMGSGRPVVLSARGEPRRLLEAPSDGPAGVVVDPESPVALAAAIRGLVSDRACAAEMGQRGRRHVREHFDRAQIAKKVEGILLDTIARGRS